MSYAADGSWLTLPGHRLRDSTFIQIFGLTRWLADMYFNLKHCLHYALR